jgi:cytochrome c553
MHKFIGVIASAILAVGAFAAEPQHWAYPLVIEKPVAPGSNESGPIQIPGSPRTYSIAQIDDLNNPPDWFPDSHAPMPNVVKSGGGKTVPACASCHVASGMGHPESSHLAGLPVEYQLRQIADFRSGARKDASRMNGIAKDLSEEDARQAAEWFAALKPIAWTKVIETDTVPKSFIGKGRMRFATPEGGSEPIGARIIELPQEPLNAARRDPRSGFIAYVPAGSIAKGEVLVKSGGGKTMPCAICHGPQLKGLAEVPAIVGISPLYLFRQLHGLLGGTRGGPSTALMQPVVARLSEDDMIAIAAYLGSMAP